MTDAPAWISAHHLQHLIVRGDAAGLPMDTLLAEAGLTRPGPALADGTVPVAAMEALLAALARRAESPSGLQLAADLQPHVLGALGHLLQSCSTFADMIETVIRFNGLLSNIGTTSLRFGPGSAEICWTCSAGGPAFQRHATEYVLGAFAVIARLLLPEQQPLIQAVNLTHATPDKARDAAGYSGFFRAPVYFGRPVSSLVVPVSALRLRLPHGDALVNELLQRHTLTLLRQRAQAPELAEQVRQLIAAMLLDAAPDKAALAKQLGMSERSLHRRLQEQGTSYRILLDAVRREQACQRLLECDEPLAAIALQLGFSTPQSFLRWFKESIGTTPGEYRRQGAAQ